MSAGETSQAVTWTRRIHVIYCRSVPEQNKAAVTVRSEVAPRSSRTCRIFSLFVFSKCSVFPSCWAPAKRIPVYLVSTGRPARASCFSAAGVSAGTRLTSDLCMCVCVGCSLQRRVPVVSLESFHTGLLYSLLFCHTLFFSLCFFFLFYFLLPLEEEEDSEFRMLSHWVIVLQRGIIGFQFNYRGFSGYYDFFLLKM